MHKYPAPVIGVLAILILSGLPGSTAGGITLPEVAMGGIIAAILVSAFLRCMSGPQLFPRYAIPVGTYIIYALLTVLLAVIYRNDPIDVFRDMYQLLPLSLAVFLPLFATRPEHVNAIIIASLVVFIVGVPGEIQAGVKIRPVYEGLRLPLMHANLPRSLALHWSTIAPFALAFLLLARKRSVRWTSVTLLLLAAVAAFFSLSRSAIAASLAGCMVTVVAVGILNPQKLKAIAWTGLVGILLLFLIVASSDLFARAVDYLLDSFTNPMGVSSLRTRAHNNALMIDQAVRSYLLGYGLGYRISVVYWDVGATRVLTPDNSFLYILVKFGLIGLSLYVYAVIQMLRCGWQVATTADEKSFWRIYALGYVGSMVSVLVDSFFNNTAVVFGGNLFLGLSTGIMGWRVLEVVRLTTRGMAR